MGRPGSGGLSGGSSLNQEFLTTRARSTRGVDEPLFVRFAPSWLKMLWRVRRKGPVRSSVDVTAAGPGVPLLFAWTFGPR
jgi:hypothetical protein